MNKQNLTQTTTDEQNSKPFIRTMYNKGVQRPHLKPGKSMTVPGQSQKLKDILKKYNVGVPTQGYRPIYSETIETDLGINPKKLDYVDIQNLSNENLIRINRLNAERKKIVDDHNAEMQKKREQEYEEQLRKKILAESQP